MEDLGAEEDDEEMAISKRTRDGSQAREES